MWNFSFGRFSDFLSGKSFDILLHMLFGCLLTFYRAFCLTLYPKATAKLRLGKPSKHFNESCTNTIKLQDGKCWPNTK